MGIAKKSIIVDVSPKEFYQVISDYERYPEFLSTVKTSEILERKGNTVDVYMEIELFKTFSYTLRMVEDPNKKVSWSLVEGDIFKENSGSWVLEAHEGGAQTKATYTTDVGLSLFVPKMITNKLVEISLPKNMEDFKVRAESLFS